MNEQKTLISNRFPKMIQDFATENFNLKMLCAVLAGTTFLSLILVLILVKRGPTVVALDSTGEISKIETKITDLQVEAATRAYLSYRYAWTFNNISAQLNKAQFFVLPSFVSAFDRSMIPVKKFVVEKKVTQRVYPRTMTVDFKTKTVTVVADRFTDFNHLKAATVMHLTLGFEIDDRTVTNPWGVYITKESENDGLGPINDGGSGGGQ